MAVRVCKPFRHCALSACKMVLLPRAWLKELKERLGEAVDYTEASRLKLVQSRNGASGP